MVLCVRALEQSFNDAAALEGLLVGCTGADAG